MYYTNYHHTNHNVETCENKKKEIHVIAITGVTTQASKPPIPLNYPCHICGIVGHKLTICPRNYLLLQLENGQLVGQEFQTP